MSLYAVPMQPNFAPAFSQFTQTPSVCFQCHTEACAVNDEDPAKRVLHWEAPYSEKVDLPPIEMGVRCARENAGQSGAPTVPERHALQEQVNTLELALQQAEEARVAALARAAALEDEAFADTEERIRKALQTAGIAGANAAKKALGPAA